MDETFELHLGNEVLQVQIRDGALRVQYGQVLNSGVVIHTEMPIFMGLCSGQIQPEAAISASLIRIEGDPGALSRFLTLSSVPNANDHSV